MASPFTITSANSIYMLQIVGLFATPVKLEGFMADAAFATTPVKPGETVMGVDGLMSVGYTPYMTPQKISLMPDSLSSRIFEDWLQAMKSASEVYIANATVTIPSIARVYTMTRGILTEINPIPDAKKVLQGRDFEITWESVEPATI